MICLPLLWRRGSPISLFWSTAFILVPSILRISGIYIWGILISRPSMVYQWWVRKAKSPGSRSTWRTRSHTFLWIFSRFMNTEQSASSNVWLLWGFSNDMKLSHEYFGLLFSRGICSHNFISRFMTYEHSEHYMWMAKWDYCVFSELINDLDVYSW